MAGYKNFDKCSAEPSAYEDTPLWLTLFDGEKA